MVVSIHQPCYLPAMRYFDKIAKSDLHIVLDHVQLEKGGFTNRTRIMQRDGRPMWLTVPVEKGKPIMHTRVEYGRWLSKHWAALSQNYGWLPVHAEIPSTLSRFCLQTAEVLRDRLAPDTPTYLSSALGGAIHGTKSELVLNLCKEVGATTYLSGPHGRNYLDLPAFEKAGIEVWWHDYPVVQPVLSAVHDLFSKERVAV